MKIYKAQDSSAVIVDSCLAAKQYKEKKNSAIVDHSIVDAGNTNKEQKYCNKIVIISDGATGIETYKAQISRAITEKLFYYKMFNGKSCDLYIKLAPDGLLLFVNYSYGDPVLCNAAISAAKLAKIPKPPSPKVYEEVKNLKLHLSI